MSTKAVFGSASSSVTLRARWRNPSSMPSKAWKNATRSSTTSEPITLATVRKKVTSARLATLNDARVGAMTRRNSRLSRSRVRRAGASMKSSACRVGGVSTTIRSQAPCSCSSWSFSVAMYSWVPDRAEEMLR